MTSVVKFERADIVVYQEGSNRDYICAQIDLKIQIYALFNDTQSISEISFL